jgi:hypothetical protein
MGLFLLVETYISYHFRIELEAYGSGGSGARGGDDGDDGDGERGSWAPTI